MQHKRTHTILLAATVWPLAAAGAGAAPAASAVSPPQTATAHHLRAHRHHASHPGGIAPLPASAPSRSRNDTQPAPVPNESVSPPDAPAPTASVEPKSFQLHYPPVGEGYVTGSSSQAMDDREAARATGVQVTVPLSQ